MCGIVGYIGPQNCVDIIIEGLSRLEYRGYDSAGISVLTDASNLEVYKKEGKLANLQQILKDKNPEGKKGIGHTRWATHGGVNDMNAHPHSTENYAIVHNGIIENADELKELLIKNGQTDYKFKSETDSEVFLALLIHELKSEANMILAIGNAFSKIKGNSALVIMDKKENAIYCVKKSAPIVCGLSENIMEGFISSDPYALVGFASKLYFPQDEVICEISLNQGKALANFFELNGTASNRYLIQDNNNKLEVASKGNFEHFMLKEIFEQPKLINNLLNYYLKNDKGIELLKGIAKNKPKKVHVMACGTAYHAGLVLKHFLEEINRIQTNVYLASEFRYGNPILEKDDLAVFISQSGETADTLACLELCKELNIKTLGIVNVEGSTIFREVDDNLLIFAGPEIGVASTKAFTQMCVMGFLLSKAYEGKLEETMVAKEVESLSASLQNILSRVDELKSIAQKIYRHQGFMFTGRGINFPISLEGALKLKEIAYVHAEGYAAGELKHGPIALIDEKMVNIAICPPHLFDKTFSNVQEIKARRGYIFSIGQYNNELLLKNSDSNFSLDYSSLPNLDGLLSNVVLQLLAYYIAKLKGTDIDKPRNLAKSVTVE